MAVLGKVLGAFFGFLLGKWFGLALGLYLGHKFDKARQNAALGGGFSRGNQQEKQQAYFRATFAVMGHIAKAKGKVTENEIRLASNLMDRMGLQGAARLAAQDAFREGKESTFPLEETLQEVRKNCGGRFDLLQFFLEVQIQAAYADGSVHPNERQVLYTVASILGFSRQQLDQRLAMQEAAFNFYQQQGNAGQQQHWQGDFSASRVKDAFKILGVDEDANSQTVKRAYRKLMNEHHPDKLAAKGLPPEMMEIAKQKAQEIQAAYDLVKKEKGYK
ncbi:co-chaperone DjlA [Enterovibrio nigricans]|uniref:Co-chaperone protein DjlA n=1 Tax=Enterovibrio nigricans DSM 22720 TaxID=1121868 RepID=A0A1T4U1W2_9GAMM|nr:co-chaperone DjlA [Enterovibrio nigricans]PKF51151.1 co-chaperone DjlA [Enterovibrio nigricans]SKA46630.1 DnaJ like chaperone protein [Enterovibrio nigricans DSM 22720]